jgi:translation elongation factor aEF-1 beta
MGTMGVKIKVMPNSPEADLSTIEETLKEIVESKGGRNREYIIEPVAFGLNAVIAFFEWPEEQALEEVEDDFENVINVNSIQIIDMRKID